MLLSDTEIISSVKSGKLIIQPFDFGNLQTASYDVCIGEWIVRTNECAYEVQDLWGTTTWYQNADSTTESETPTPWSDSYNYWGNPEKSQDGYHIIKPNELILAHTIEYIGSTPGSNITTKMHAKSTTGRIGISVCSCAGLGDIGFFNRWCMEIKNNSSATVKIPVGAKIAQISFHQTTDTVNSYTMKGNYQTQDESLKGLMKDWSPLDLYPKLKKKKIFLL